ncbi:MAG: hypothetical protein ACYCZW_02260 [Minisyncoccota bacterium]
MTLCLYLGLIVGMPVLAPTKPHPQIMDAKFPVGSKPHYGNYMTTVMSVGRRTDSGIQYYKIAVRIKGIETFFIVAENELG